MSAINNTKKTFQYFVLTVIIVGFGFASADHHEYEQANDLSAASVLPAELLKGDNHTVEDQVRNDGYLNYYTINSDYGEFEAISTQMPRTRVGEINALGELDELSKTEVFVQAAADAGMGQIGALGQFAKNPVESEAEANFLIKSVTMLAWHHINQKPVKSVLSNAAIPVGINEDGSAALLFAVDHVYWTESIAEAAGNHESQSGAAEGGAGEVWLLSSASDGTRSTLSSMGFAVHENVAPMMLAQ